MSTLGPIKTDQDAVNAILALSLVVHVESWRSQFAVLGDETIPETIANAIADLQRCARRIQREQAGAPEPEDGGS